MKKNGCTVTLGALLLALGCDPATSTTSVGDDDSTSGEVGTGEDDPAGATSSAGAGETVGQMPTPGGDVTQGSATGDAGSSDGSGESGSGESGSGESGSGESGSGESGSGESGSGESGGQTFVISGTVVADIAPGGDGMGTVYVGLTTTVDCFDGTPGYGDVIANADLSTIGNTVAFSFDVPSDEASGANYLLQVFLDDNSNADFPAPDGGDMTRFPTGFEEDAGCFALPNLDGGDIAGLVVELDYVIP